MNPVQQQPSFKQSYNEKMEKLQLTPDMPSSQSMSITSIEHMSNEFFYEVFDYLDGYIIHKAFSKLNHRFHQLLNSSSLLFKIRIRSTYDEPLMNNYEQIISLYKHQIFSLGLSLTSQKNHFFSSFAIDSSFDHLESLVLNEIKPIMLTSLFTSLTCLPRLFSLTIDASSISSELDDVYRLIFAIPKLKYAKLSAEDCNRPISLPTATDTQMSTIEHLVIDHPCTFGELFVLLSYTPQLCYLKFQHNSESDSTIHTLLPITLSNLISISMTMMFVTFDEFEMFITQLDCELKVLRVTNQSEDMDYFDGDRWEELISDYLPELEKFYFQFTKQIDHEADFKPYLTDPHQFTSEFWIEREWVLEIEMDSFELVYSIHPYKEQWYDIDSSIDLSESIRLTLSGIPSGNNEDLFLFRMNIRDCLPLAYIYHLEIPRTKIFSGTLLDIIHALPELDSLKVPSLSLSPTRYSSVEEKNLRRVSNKNKITKVCLENMTEIEDIGFLMKLCPCMTYLQVNRINNLDIESFLIDILMKININCHQHLRSLCFRVPTADDKLIKRLAAIINSKKLLTHYVVQRSYTIKRVLDNIYLEWERLL